MSSKVYKTDGVDVKLGDIASKIASEFCKATYESCPVARVVDMSNGNFRGPRGIELAPKFRQDGYYLGCAPDGIGTKVILHDSAKSWAVAAYDLIAMTSFDLVRWGGLPIYFSSVLDVKTLGEDEDSDAFNAVKMLYFGAANACHKVGMIMLNGETAELNATVTSENKNATLMFNWGGCAQGIYNRNKMILGDTLQSGQVVMILKENGFRSNGIGSVRKAFSLKFGENWHLDEKAKAYIKAASTPSVLYDRFFCDINGWFDDENFIKVHSLIHLTGGSFESKLGKDILFPLGLSANLTNLYSPPEIMKECAQWRGMSCKDVYETWNGGQGALAIIDEKDVDRFILCANSYNLDTHVGGIITSNAYPSVKIKSALSEEIIEFKWAYKALL